MMKFLTILLLSFWSGAIYAQTITTFAGTGSSVFSGNNIPATAAGIPNPRGGTFDKFGNYYFTDGLNNQVRKIDIVGIITTVAGNGLGGYNGDGISATSAKLYHPESVIFDTFGNMYIADVQNYRVRKIDVLSGNIFTIAGRGIAADSGDGGPATASCLSGPTDLCFDKWGSLYIADNYSVRKIDTFNIISTIAGNGTAGSSGDNGLATNAQINGCLGIAADDSGNIYVAERTGNRVRKVNNIGIITTFAGNGSATYLGDGIPATNAQIVPLKLGFDTSKHLYITDDYNERVFFVNNIGIINNVVGNGIAGYSGDNGPATSAKIDGPAGVAFDQCGNLYFPEVTSHIIRKVTFDTSCHLHPTTVNEPKSNTEISIYPNPANSLLTIQSSNKISSILITNLHGQTLFCKSGIEEEKAEINIEYLPSGVYFVAVVDESGRKIIRKFIKE